MNYTILFQSAVCVAMIHSFALAEEVATFSTIPVELGESQESIIRKAAQVVPTSNQLDALKNEFIAFINMGPNTFTCKEWGDGKEDPKVFDLKTLDTDQWCRVMKTAGMKMVIMTVKHHDGFCLWQTRYTDHGMMSSNFENGKGDILRELVQSCQKYGLKLGIYVSPADLYQMENPQGLYGNGSKATKRTIPRNVPGRPFKSTEKFEFEVDDYNEYFLNQLYELLTEYGPVNELWFDGAHPKSKGGQKYNYTAWKELIHKLAPKAVVFGREDIRWCGNEAGGTRASEWNVIPYQFDPLTSQQFPDITDNDIASREKLYAAKFLHYQPTEVNTSIREGWFYRDDTNQKVRNADDVFDIYERAVGGNSVLLLNIPPNREGKFSPADVQCLEEVGQRIRETYGTDLLKGAQGDVALLDDDLDTFVQLPGLSGELILSMSHPVTINRLVLQEAIAKCGERVEEHAVDAWIDGAWKEIAQATNIGYKRILRFPDVTTDKIRVRVLQSRSVPPGIAKVSAHFYKNRPPQLQATVSRENRVTLESVRHQFGWKSHGQDAAKNLGGTMVIHYTVDGTDPTASSPVYKAPFTMDCGMLKALAIAGGQAGPEFKVIVGYPKNAWTLAKSSGQEAGHEADKAFDGNDQTYWLTPSGQSSHFLELDLGTERLLSGFAYTPQKENAKGMMERGVIKTSQDGKSWSVLENFEFGNLINDPTKREHFFKKKVKARYIRVEATGIAAGGKELSIAELSLF